MKKILFPLTLCATALAGPAVADTFQAEGSAGVTDHSAASNADHWQLGGRFYLNPVSTDRGPYELNSFLNHSTYLQLNGDFNDHIDSYNIAAHAITAGNWVVDAKYGNLNPDHGSSADIYRIGGGRYLDDSTLLSGYYQRLEWGAMHADTVGVHIKHYQPLAGQTGLLLQGELSNTNPNQGDDVFAVKANADYFFNKQWSAGGGVTLVSNNNPAAAYPVTKVADNTYYANTSYWFNPRANVKVGINKTEGQAGMGWGVSGTYRF